MAARTVPLQEDKVWISVTQCAWCRSIKLRDWYVKLPHMPMVMWHHEFSLPVLPSLVFSMTHGVCPTCGEKVCRSAKKWREGQRTNHSERTVTDEAITVLADRDLKPEPQPIH